MNKSYTKWYAKNRVHQLAKMNEYYYDNKEQINKKNREIYYKKKYKITISHQSVKIFFS